MEATYQSPRVTRKDRKAITEPLITAALAVPGQWASIPLNGANQSERSLARMAVINAFLRRFMKVETRIVDDRLYVKIVPATPSFA